MKETLQRTSGRAYMRKDAKVKTAETVSDQVLLRPRTREHHNERRSCLLWLHTRLFMSDLLVAVYTRIEFLIHALNALKLQ